MDVRSARKIGFFSTLAMSVGSIIGIGIFLKNRSVLQSQAFIVGDLAGTFSFWSLIVAWILAAVITFCSALSFSEISSSRTSNAGLSGWAEQLSNKRVGRFIRFNHCMFYYAIFGSLIPFLSVEGLYNAINISINGTGAQEEVHFGFIFLGGFIVLASLIALNYFSLRSSSYFQNITTILKAVPIVLVLIIGVSNINQSNVLLNSNLDSQNIPINSPIYGVYKEYIGNEEKFFVPPTLDGFNLQGLFLALPSIFFSFDSYTNIGNLAKNVKDPHKNIPLAMVVAIVIAAVIYITISIGVGFTGFGDAGSILTTLIPDNFENSEVARNSINIAINVFITISAFGVCNAMTASFLRSGEALIESGQIVGWRKLEALNNKHHGLGALVLIVIIAGVINITVGLTGTILNTDALADSITNVPTLCFLAIYGFIIALGIYDRFTKKQCRPVFGFMVAAPIAVIGIFGIFMFFLVYQYFIVVIEKPIADSNAGLFFAGGENRYEWLNRDDMIVFWVFIVLFFTVPVANHFILKKYGGYKPEAQTHLG